MSDPIGGGTLTVWESSSDELGLLVGIAELLHGASVGVWDEDGGYAANDVAIVLTGLPSGPDQAISLDAYDVSNDATYADTTLGVQVRTRGSRGDARVVKALDSGAFDVLQGIHSQLVGGVWVIDVTKVSGSSLGIDDNQRHLRTANYYVRIHRPGPNRL